jgi:signal transduction histidine kinase
MTTRSFGLIILALVGVLPLVGFGYVAVHRAERTAVAEVRSGNRELAASVAERIAAFAVAERDLLKSIGAAAALASDREAAEAILEAYALNYRRFRNLAIFDQGGELVAGRASEHARPLIDQALAGRPARTQARPADPDTSGAFSHAFSLAAPILVAGASSGVIAADVDLVGIWRPVNDILIGRTGFARLVSTDGQLLAHGNPEERRFVFQGVTEENAGIVAGALLGQVVENQQGHEVVATAAFVPGLPWLVVIEQQVAEAFAPARALTRSLWLWSGAAAIIAVGVGLSFGRTLVRPIERLREHTKLLARGELEARVDPRSRLVEARALADALNDMAASLRRLQDEAQERERLATFSRVAAGLAHDLRQPIEAVRTACELFVREPDDAEARALVGTVTARDLPRLKRYMDDLHRLARRGEMHLDLEPVEPRAIADRVVESLRTSPKWGGVEFVAGGEAEAIEADPQLVERAVTNLAANGADACVSQQQGGRVSIEVAQDEARVAFRVTDTGHGIEAARVPGLFHADFKSTKRTSGVGLGLGVVRQVVESHGGQVEVESALGQGSTFTIWLPRTPMATPEAETENRDGEPDQPSAGASDGNEGTDYGRQAPEARVG